MFALFSFPVWSLILQWRVWSAIPKPIALERYGIMNLSHRHFAEMRLFAFMEQEWFKGRHTHRCNVSANSMMIIEHDNVEIIYKVAVDSLFDTEMYEIHEPMFRPLKHSTSIICTLSQIMIYKQIINSKNSSLIMVIDSLRISVLLIRPQQSSEL